MSANQLEERVVGVLRVWYDWTIFPTSYMHGLEAVFLQTESDIARFAKVMPPDNNTSALDSDIEGLRRKAKLAGISVAVPPRSHRDEAVEYYDGLTLYRKLAYVADFTAIKEAALGADLPAGDDEEESRKSRAEVTVPPPPPVVGSRGARANIVRRHHGAEEVHNNEEDIDGAPIEVDDNDDVDGVPFLQNSDDVDGVPYEDVDGLPFEEEEDTYKNVVVDDDDVDGVPYDDDIDGVPFEEE
jgi:hypothetical protein